MENYIKTGRRWAKHESSRVAAWQARRSIFREGLDDASARRTKVHALIIRTMRRALITSGQLGEGHLVQNLFLSQLGCDVATARQRETRRTGEEDDDGGSGGESLAPPSTGNIYDGWDIAFIIYFQPISARFADAVTEDRERQRLLSPRAKSFPSSFKYYRQPR